MGDIGRPRRYIYDRVQKPLMRDKEPFPVKPHMMEGITVEMLMSGRAKPAKSKSHE